MSINQKQGRTAKVRWKTDDDFRAMTNDDLEKYKTEYQGILHSGVIVRQGGRATTHAEQIRLRYYLAVIEGIQQQRGVITRRQAEEGVLQ